MLAYQLLCHTYKSYVGKYTMGLRYRHDYDQFRYGIYVSLNLPLRNMQVY